MNNELITHIKTQIGYVKEDMSNPELVGPDASLAAARDRLDGICEDLDSLPVVPDIVLAAYRKCDELSPTLNKTSQHDWAAIGMRLFGALTSVIPGEEPATPIKEYLSDDVNVAPITEEFWNALCEARTDGCDVSLSLAIQRWQNDELITPQIARLIDESDWPLTDRLNRAHKAFMLDWEGDAYEGRHVPKYPPRENWVTHVDFYHDGSVGVDRYGQDVRVYQPTETSKRRLENTINRLCWSWRPPTKLDANFSTLKNRAVAPMRRFQ